MNPEIMIMELQTRIRELETELERRPRAVTISSQVSPPEPITRFLKNTPCVAGAPAVSIEIETDKGIIYRFEVAHLVETPNTIAVFKRTDDCLGNQTITVLKEEKK